MNFDLDPETDLEALAREELTGSEVRLLLERLSMKDVGPANPTVGAVAEVCGVSTMVVGRMLAEIRQANLHELYGRTLESHGEKIKRLDHSVDRILKVTGLHRPVRRHSEVDSATSSVVTTILLATLFFAFFGILAYGLTRRPEPAVSLPVETPASEAVWRVLPNGDILRVDGTGRITVVTDTGERTPTKEERKLADTLRFSDAALRGVPTAGSSGN